MLGKKLSNRFQIIKTSLLWMGDCGTRQNIMSAFACRTIAKADFLFLCNMLRLKAGRKVTANWFKSLKLSIDF
jgi:hypothetical protein